ncbi:MAG: response regulator [Oscillospiraceae bacterium]|nr:response regulator [Oscillospiraceae bacterium]
MNSSREKIIIVDDIATNLSIAKSALSDKYDVFTAPSGDKLFLLLSKLTPDLILLDIEMPEMDGYDIIKRLKKAEKTMHIPVIFLTGKIDPEHEIMGLNLGAVDYITKPFSRELLSKRIDLHVLMERQKHELLKHNLSLESEIDKKSKTVMELQSAILKTIAELVECRDDVTGDHIGRTQYSLRLLISLLIENKVYAEELSALDIPLLIMSSQLHDVGKISIRDNILMKKGKLTKDEFEEMKNHTGYGADIIRRIESSTTENEFLLYAEVFAETHHERWDGTGYPNGLKGEEIPLQGRLMAIVDVYDALVSSRPYKDAFSHETAINIIKDGLGTQFDPHICRVFVDNHSLFRNVSTQKSIAENLQDLQQVAASAIDNTTIGGIERNRIEKMQRYIEILFDAMLKHRKLKHEVASWDKELFIKSVLLHDVTDFTDNNKVNDVVGDDLKRLLLHAETASSSNHEKWDGTGYPLGLKEKDIPTEGRLMAIADVYDALTTDRTHRSKKTHKEAVLLIKNGTGTHFDPHIVELFLEHEKEFEKVSG